MYRDITGPITADAAAAEPIADRLFGDCERKIDWDQAPVVYLPQAIEHFTQLLADETSPDRVLTLCEALDEAAQRYERTLERIGEEGYGSDPGYIYFIRLRTSKNKRECPIKIGKSRNLPRRVSEISTLMPWPVEILHTIQTYDMTRLERQLHYLFRESRMEGEWFMLSQTAIEWIRSKWTYDLFQDDIDTRLDIHADIHADD